MQRQRERGSQMEDSGTNKSPAEARMKNQGIAEAITWFYTHYMTPHFGLLLVVIVAMIIQTMTVVYFTHFVQPLTDAMFFSPEQANTVALCLTVIVIFSLRGLTSLIYRAGLEDIFAKATANLRRDLVARLAVVDFPSYDTLDSADLAARVGNNINELREQLINSLASSVLGLLTVVGLTTYLVYLNTWLALVMFLAFAVIAVGLTLINRLIKAIRTRALIAFADLSVELDFFLDNQRSVRLNSVSNWFRSRILLFVKEAEMAARRQGYLMGALAPIIDITIGLSIAVVILIGLNFIESNRMTAPELITFFTGLLNLYIPVKRVANLGALLRTLSVSIGSIRWIFDLPLEDQNNEGEPPLAPEVAGKAIHFQNVTFAYQNSSDRAVLHDFSVTIPARKLTMFVGESGSGKSTIPALLTGCYPLTNGKIVLGERTLTLKDRYALRNMTSYLGQEILLLNENAETNLTPFKTEHSIDNAKMLNLVELSDVDLIANSERLGPRGSRLSGGQRQRLALAQSLLAKKPIAIFDEPTSALNRDLAIRMVKTIKTARQGMTTIMIVHDMELIKYADHVIKLVDGRAKN